MRRFVTVLVALFVVSLGVAGTAWAAPRWTRTVGLDVWNLGAEKTSLERARAEHEEWEGACEQARRRLEVMEGIVADWADGRLALPETIDAVLAVVRSSPEWCDRARVVYQVDGLPPTATDRDVVVWYLRVKLALMRNSAEEAGQLDHVLGSIQTCPPHGDDACLKSVRDFGDNRRRFRD